MLCACSQGVNIYFLVLRFTMWRLLLVTAQLHFPAARNTRVACLLGATDRAAHRVLTVTMASVLCSKQNFGFLVPAQSAGNTKARVLGAASMAKLARHPLFARPLALTLEAILYGFNREKRCFPLRSPWPTNLNREVWYAEFILYARLHTEDTLTTPKSNSFRQETCCATCCRAC